jgi:predicted RNase H-like HicB family nuclease
MTTDSYTYTVTWSAEDGEHVGQCAEFPSLSWLAKTPKDALEGIRRVVAESDEDMAGEGRTLHRPAVIRTDAE